MNPYQMFKTDEKMETDGIWIDYGSFKVLISRAGGANEKYKKLLAKRSKPYKRQIENGTLADEVNERVTAGIYADSIILDWEGDIGPGGKKAEYSRDGCIHVLLDLPDLFRDIREQALSMANFRAEALVADSEN